VCGIKHRVVAIPTIHLQLASMNRVAEGNRLLWLVTNVQCFGVRDQTANRTGVNAAAYRGDTDQQKRAVDPTGKEKSFHNSGFPRARHLLTQGHKVAGKMLVRVFD
jgi:hypothetical protein